MLCGLSSSRIEDADRRGASHEAVLHSPRGVRLPDGGLGGRHCVAARLFRGRWDANGPTSMILGI